LGFSCALPFFLAVATVYSTFSVQLENVAACTHQLLEPLPQSLASDSIRPLATNVPPSGWYFEPATNCLWSAVKAQWTFFMPLPHCTRNQLYNLHGFHAKGPNLAALRRATVMTLGSQLKLTGHGPLLPLLQQWHQVLTISPHYNSSKTGRLTSTSLATGMIFWVQ